MSEEKNHRQKAPMTGMPPFQPYPPMPMPGFQPMPPMQPMPAQPLPAGQFQPGPPGFQGFPPQAPQPPQQEGLLPLEESYVENILRLNRGKVATVYMTFDNNERWNAKIFKGIIEAAGRDHIILSDPETEKRYLLLTIYLDYITFDEPIEYDYPFS
ncbi:spore germination protein Q [Amphibacillus marinus]|uniref:Spore germination protein Q n=1 Tax=Amphibacillus marinus TaxID=872970 RepID=A0A1H8MYM0_9BACI|nr:spore coat protein GerQ [Amphibacillus marinus]SEO22402.1 spore germination protein Q [Amphibacillus marinus]